MNALKLGMTLKTISSFDLSVNDEIWGVPVGTEFTFKESFTCPALYRHMFRIIDSHGLEHVISDVQFFKHLKRIETLQKMSETLKEGIKDDQKRYSACKI